MTLATPFSPLQVDHAEKYDDTPRLDLLDLIDRNARSVLEVGCSAGATGFALKARMPQVYYCGLELDERAAVIARSRLDRVVVANVENVNLEHFDLRKGSFDVVLCADVLEHLYDPWKTLATLREYLTPAGSLVASIPNTQHLALILDLIRGNWSYARYGLLDATHIRFFTFAEIARLFSAAGFEVIACHSKFTAAMPEPPSWPTDLDCGSVVLKGVTREEAQKLFTFQYLVVARPVSGAVGGGGE
jgi:2-polyprenyl-3-methyl-5-hydroxy-6-metoxy-1,4-benzoquinol methylase